mmetsp:Transcript_74435/g.168620  ORF Transcript_74435/g.168620 Transcript_74435/m.168620 type:complete len:215 (+) Transcript_74435:329-973(+)
MKKLLVALLALHRRGDLEVDSSDALGELPLRGHAVHREEPYAALEAALLKQGAELLEGLLDVLPALQGRPALLLRAIRAEDQGGAAPLLGGVFPGGLPLRPQVQPVVLSEHSGRALPRRYLVDAPCLASLLRSLGKLYRVHGHLCSLNELGNVRAHARVDFMLEGALQVLEQLPRIALGVKVLNHDLIAVGLVVPPGGPAGEAVHQRPSQCPKA